MSALTFRSIYSASIDGVESQCDPLSLKVESLPQATASAVDDYDATKDDSFNDEKEPKSNHEKDYKGDPIKLPESTHSLFFTSSFFSLPALFALCISALSVGCLVLALINGLDKGTPLNPFGVPQNISSSTRGAQYLAIFVVLLMEEGESI